MLGESFKKKELLPYKSITHFSENKKKEIFVL